MTPTSQQLDGEWWFSVAHSAKLLRTTKKAVETMAIRGLLRSRGEHPAFLIAESDVTELRRDPAKLKDFKRAAKLPPKPKRADEMPDATKYVGDNKGSGIAKGRIGNPLADEGQPKV